MQRAMKHRLGALVIGGLVATLSLTSCGGGGDSGTSTSPAATPVVTSGTITGFGSVFVNDRKFEINDSTKTTKDDSTVNGDANAKLVLKQGMVVTVSGTSSGTTRTASTIEHQNTLEGPITSAFDAVSSRFEVLGIPVIVDDRTKFDTGLATGNLTVGVFVEVSGFVQPNGLIAAGFIEKKTAVCTAASLCEVRGTVTAHDSIGGTFKIGNLIIDYKTRPATIDNSMTLRCGAVWDICFVEVKGDSFTNAIPPILIATKVEPDDFDAPNGNQVELEGFVTAVLGAGQFKIGSTEVQAVSAVYLGGLIGDIAIGQKLEVQGSISNKVITATKVKFQDAVRLEGDVVAPSSTAITLVGLGNISISANSQTKFDGIASLGDLATGNHIEVRGRQGSGNTVIATEIKLLDPNPKQDLILQGVVQSKAANLTSITILGETLTTANVEKFLNSKDALINIQTFFGAITPDATKVKAKGKYLGGPVWKEMELESD